MNKKHKIIFLLILDDIEGKQQFGNRHTKRSLKSFSIKNHLRGFKFFEIIQNHEYHTGAYGYLFEAVFVLALCSTVKSVLKILCIDTFTFKSISNIFELHKAWVSIPETFQSFPGGEVPLLATFSHFSCFQDI